MPWLCEESCVDVSTLLCNCGLLTAGVGLEACEIGVDKLSGLRNKELVMLGSFLAAIVLSVVGGVHMNELRNVLACLDKVMRKELLDEAEDRLDAVESVILSWSCAEEADRLELDLLGCGLWSTAELDELAEAIAGCW